MSKPGPMQQSREGTRRSMPANTNNSASKGRTNPRDSGQDSQSDTHRVALTREPDVYPDMRPVNQRVPCAPSNIESVRTSSLDHMLRAVFWDERFRKMYNYSSLFLIGAGAYGHVFRVVSNASGPIENPLYSENYVRFLQTLRRTKSRRKQALLDSYRDSLCLDLVAMKIEALTPEDVDFHSANKIQLVKEFCMLTELFRNQSSSNALVGFPLPIEFGFLGNDIAAKDFKKVPVLDMYGRPSDYKDTYLGESSILKLSQSDVTYISYMTMELVGPNLDEWKSFFAAKHAECGGQLVFSVQTTLKLMDQVLCRLLVMHRKNMVHLDLKPDNLCMGIGKMTNTVYLLDYGLSRICSDDKPNITMGSRRYMSVGVLKFEPANYMMDIESWFYVLMVLLTDFVPWSDDILQKMLGEFLSDDQEQKLLLVTQLKKQFWGDEGNLDKKLMQRVVDKAVAFHKSDVPDIGAIIMDIYSHVLRMRNDFYGVSAQRMHSDIRNDESDLFKRYHTLRKLLLFPYDCNFAGKGSCFAHDKDLGRKQEARRTLYPMLVFAENGRNWHWDWDVWYAEEYGGKDSRKNPNNQSGILRSSSRSPQKRPIATDHRQQALMPDWMKHYLARVLGSAEEVAPDVETINSTRIGPEGILVA